MNKEQQIEEMATFIHGRRDKNGSEKTAKALFEAGYRKVPKYAVILSPEERDEEMKAYNEDKKEHENELLTIQMACVSAYVEAERLKAENKQLQEKLNSANAGNVNCSGCELIEINAVKEFARKVKNCSYCDNVFMDGKWHRYVFVDDIDELLREYEG